MFNNIRRRLVILNAAVFLLVLIVLSGFLYAHMHFRLFHDTDEVLSQAQSRILSYRNLAELTRIGHGDPQQDERTTYLFWNAQGELVGQLPNESFPASAAQAFWEPSGDSTPHSVSAGHHTYRILQIPNNKPGPSAIASISIVRNLEDVEGTLHALLLDLTVGIAAGLALSVLAGLFLAGRALVPIRNAWDKQQRFVADASHELRTPTAIIHAQTELLLKHPDHSIERESPNIAVILKESKQMSKLLDDLLTLARSDSNQLQIQPALFELDALLRELSKQFQFLASTKDVEIRTNLQAPLTMWGDEARIRQLLIILLDNALKYTPASGHIEITGRYQSNSVHISVKDTGCGIAEEDLPHIFERFYRSDKVRSRTEGGTGLGLSIARWIAEAHGGLIQVHSKLNAGTQVELHFPRKRNHS